MGDQVGRVAAETPAIELRDVSKRYRGDTGREVVAVDHVSLSIPAGQFVCVVGPSGHGKTTLLNLVAGFQSPTSGQVLVNGVQVGGPGADRGVVFQRDTLFLWKRVKDNIGFGPKARGVPKAEREQLVREYLRIIGLERFGRAWPKELSGGMRRRVAIAAVFANDPAVMLMDEPFVGLDYVRRGALHEVLLRLWTEKRKTILFITHDVDEAIALGDRMIVMANGRICLEASIDLARPRTVEALGTGEAVRLRVEALRHLEGAVRAELEGSVW